MKTAIGYIRVSTPGQVDEGISLEAQQAKVEAWCVANDVDLSAVFMDAVSGKRADNRPELQNALQAVTDCGGILVVYSLSRLARSTRDTLDIGERLEKAGADLVSLSEKIDTTSAAGKMVFRLMAVMAEFERDLISERTASALAHMKQQGKRTGTIPYGFDLHDDQESLVPNPDEQRIIDWMVDLRSEGLSLRRIAAQLTTKNIPTKSGNAEWTHTAVRRIVLRVAA
jgi:DNA invertase Pin-like site-specific DNA recombinase